MSHQSVDQLSEAIAAVRQARDSAKRNGVMERDLRPLEVMLNKLERAKLASLQGEHIVANRLLNEALGVGIVKAK